MITDPDPAAQATGANRESGAGSQRDGGPSPASAKRFLVFLPSFHGGIAKYATEQARELARRGNDVIVLSTRTLGLEPEPNLRVSPLLINVPQSIRSKLWRRALLVLTIMFNQAVLVCAVAWLRPKVVLFDCYSEILAPLWSWPHLALSKIFDVRYAMTIHDPQRIRQFGPQWWHHLSVWAAYLPFSIGLVHGLDRVDPAWIPRDLPLVDVPHGVFTVARAVPREPMAVREKLRIPAGAAVALAFGYVADRKNLDLAIRSVAAHDNVHLIIAGQQASSTDRPLAYYAELAKELRIAARIHFVDGYILENELGGFFDAADVVFLTYRAGFVSQSGALHLAGNWDKPVLASSGPGPLVDAVRTYGLGIAVEPDSEQALSDGLRRILAGDYPPLGWDQFRHEASWKVNIDRLLDALADE